ncbi:MAG: alkaline phosphatase family protein [Blastocatellales bacterium]|nr:alkaline phosphatase family protein [Blastocatellales bacterium]
MIIRRLPPIIVLVCLAAASAYTQPIADLKPTVILISIDGFHPDYLEKYRPANLRGLARAGVRASWMYPAFPSKTFPNHYTVVTGLYPQNHGIVENTIYSREFDAVFSLGARKEVSNGRWWLGEPIWVTAERQGQRAAAMFFPGSEAEIAGYRPSYWKPYDGKVPNEERVDTVLGWLDLPVAERPTFFTLYFSDVDDAGHGYGPDAEETREAVLKVDAVMGRLIEGLKARRVFDRVNIIIVSDHGMARVDPRDTIVVDELFDQALAEKILWTAEIVSIFPNEGKEDEIYESLRRGLPPQARVWRKKDLPARFHYSNSPRIAPLLVLPDVGWRLMTRARFDEMRAREGWERIRGSHGYDNRAREMRALFIAHGSAFRRGLRVAPFENIHIYNVMAKILKLNPAPNDGNMRLARRILR